MVLEIWVVCTIFMCFKYIPDWDLAQFCGGAGYGAYGVIRIIMWSKYYTENSK